MRFMRWLGGAAAMYLLTTVTLFPVCVLLDVQYNWKIVTAAWILFWYMNLWRNLSKK